MAVAIDAYLLACTSSATFTTSEIERNTKNLLLTFKYCKDPFQLLQLNFLLHELCGSTHLTVNTVRCFAAYIHVMLNTSQPVQAKELFVEIMNKDLDVERRDRLNLLPYTRLLDNLALNTSCDEILQVLKVIRLVQPTSSMRFLSHALENSHHDLSVFIFDNDIEPQLENPGLTKSYNRNTLLQVLRVLAANGEVRRTLALIETYFLHELLRGRKALTKELSLNIIEAYCYHVSPQRHDEAIMRVLDIVSGLNSKLEKEGAPKLNYKDITEALSHRFMKYRDDDATPERGNRLADLGSLSQFINEHLAYIKQKGYGPDVTRLFMNCVLNHMNLFQTFTGTVRALLAFQKSDPEKFKTLLDKDSIDIILSSASNSNGAKMASIHLYQLMKSQKVVLTVLNYRCLISASLRGDFHQQLQFLLYNYATDFPGPVDRRVKDLLISLPRSITEKSPATRVAIEHVTNSKNSRNLDDVWDEHNICKISPSIADANLPGFSRQYNHSIDTRDTSYLQFITRDIVLNLHI